CDQHKAMATQAGLRYIPDHNIEAGRMSTMLVPLLIVGIVIMSVVWYLSHRLRLRHSRTVFHSAGLEVLATRYARGAVNREEYLQKRDDILADHVHLELYH